MPPRPRPSSRQPAANSSLPEERPRPSRASRRRTGSSSSSGTASRRSQLTAHRRLSRIFCHFAKSWRNSAASPSRGYPNNLAGRCNQRPPSGRPSFYQAGLAGLYLQAEILRVDAALGETAGDKPETRLGRAHEHVAQLLVIAETPDRTNAVRDIIAEQFANQMFLAFEAGRQDDQICHERFAAAQAGSLRDKFSDIGELHQFYLTIGDQIGTADIEIVAAAAGEIFELPARSIFT